MGARLRSLKTVYNREYRIWMIIIQRCHNPKHQGYARYGGAGITMHKDWRDPTHGFERFFAEIGGRPTKRHSVDRIDNSKGYEPGNVRWSTPAQQRANQTRSKGSSVTSANSTNQSKPSTRNRVEANVAPSQATAKPARKA